jgi:hypothetical protein
MATKAERQALRERVEKMFERVCACDCIGKEGSAKWSRDFAKFEADCAAVGIDKLRAVGIGYHALPLKQQPRKSQPTQKRVAA